MRFTFENPAFLWLLLSIPLLIISHFFISKNLKTSAWRFANFEAIQRITGGKPTLTNAIKLNRNIILLLIKCLILALLIFAAAQTTFWYTGKSPNSNFVIAIDASSSMLARDFEPNRLEAAKESAEIFVDTVGSTTKIGVISFSGESFVEQQLLSDKFRTKETIKKISSRAVAGTDLSGAIISASNMLSGEASSTKSKTIILLTDGRSTTGASIKEGVDYANKNNVGVYTIGLGTKEGGSFANIDLVSTVDDDSLTFIAESTGAKYFRTANEEELKQAYLTIANSKEENVSKELTMPLLMIGLALIFIEWGLAATKFRTLP